MHVETTNCINCFNLFLISHIVTPIFLYHSKDFKIPQVAKVTRI